MDALHKSNPPLGTSNILQLRPGSFTRSEIENIHYRLATIDDTAGIHLLYHKVYQGRYGYDYATNPQALASVINSSQGHLLLVAEQDSQILGCVLFEYCERTRMGKASGIVVDPDVRSQGVGSHLLQMGVNHLTQKLETVDVIYACSRTISEAPSKMLESSGFHRMGLFPNAVHVKHMEHLNLDVLLTDKAFSKRRKRPFIFAPYHEVYEIAQRTLGLEDAHIVTEFSQRALTPNPFEFRHIEDTKYARDRFSELSEQNKLANSFFPFHEPNLVLATPDGSSEIFARVIPMHKQAEIMGYRTDQTNLHDLFDSAAKSLHAYGAAYVEFLVDVYDFKLQQEAFTARFIPSAYFPAMRLAADGLRDDVFVLSRTFNLLDFSEAVMNSTSYEYLRAYLRRYHDLYIKPILSH